MASSHLETFWMWTFPFISKVFPLCLSPPPPMHSSAEKSWSTRLLVAHARNVSSPAKESLSDSTDATYVTFCNPPVATSVHQSPPLIELHCCRFFALLQYIPPLEHSNLQFCFSVLSESYKCSSSTGRFARPFPVKCSDVSRLGSMVPSRQTSSFKSICVPKPCDTRKRISRFRPGSPWTQQSSRHFPTSVAHHPLADIIFPFTGSSGPMDSSSWVVSDTDSDASINFLTSTTPSAWQVAAREKSSKFPHKSLASRSFHIFAAPFP